MGNVIVATILVVIVSVAIIYIIKEKKKGTVCIGCPNAGTCASKQHEKTGCNCH